MDRGRSSARTLKETHDSPSSYVPSGYAPMEDQALRCAAPSSDPAPALKAPPSIAPVSSGIPVGSSPRPQPTSTDTSTTGDEWSSTKTTSSPFGSAKVRGTSAFRSLSGPANDSGSYWSATGSTRPGPT